MKALLLLPICLLAAAPALGATTINFEGYPDPTDVYSLSESGATFTADGSTDLFEISSYGVSTWGTSGPKILCPHTANLYCGGAFTVTFASPVTNLQFYFTGDDTTAALNVQAFLNGTSLGSTSVNGDGSLYTAQLVNLSSFGQITSIKVTPPTTDGFGYDDFSFTPVPEASTWAMMLLGFGGIGMALKRRRERTLASC